MMIHCQEHGDQGGVQVSPDIEQSIRCKETCSTHIVNYEFEGEVVDTFYLSKSYAESNGLELIDVLPLPDDYPKWVLDLNVVCEVCFNSYVKK